MESVQKEQDGKSVSRLFLACLSSALWSVLMRAALPGHVCRALMRLIPDLQFLDHHLQVYSLCAHGPALSFPPLSIHICFTDLFPLRIPPSLLLPLPSLTPFSVVFAALAPTTFQADVRCVCMCVCVEERNRLYFSSDTNTGHVPGCSNRFSVWPPWGQVTIKSATSSRK